MAHGFKTGGRQKGTLNKNNPTKINLRNHSAAYSAPTIVVNQQLVDMLNKMLNNMLPPDARYQLTLDMLTFMLGCSVGDKVSRLDIDVALLPPAVRLDAEVKVLNYSQAKMQSTSVDMSITDDSTLTIQQRLASLAADNDTP